ncbi:MAG TPA: hypothetical protein VGO67_07980 [Verrucomicrobiae bacterium]|jgi:hypothetical protein
MDNWRIYIREALTQLEFAKRSFTEFQNARASGDAPSVFYNLHHFILHVANVDKLLDPKPNSPRASLLAAHANLSEVDLKSFRRLRNHLEHFDERLDKWVADFDRNAFFDMNIITGAKGFPTKAFLRALDGDVFKFYGEDYPLHELQKSVELLYVQLSAIEE